MTEPGQILIVDDDNDFAELYREILTKLGTQVLVANSVEDGRSALKSHGMDLDVVLLDQKLQGPGGPDSGLELISEAGHSAPFAKIIVVTGYSTPDVIDRAFRLGVYDYLVKNGAFESLLKAKVRNAVEVASERRLAATSTQQLTGQLQTAWQKLGTETDRYRKGLLLEELVKMLFRATSGFERVETRLRTDSEEIDIRVENGSVDTPWRSDGPYLLGECKNWTSKCGAKEFRDFYGKLTTKYGRVRTGFFVSVGGFTEDFYFERASRKTEDVLVIPLDASDLQRWVNAANRLEVLRELHSKAVFEKHQ